MAPQERDRRPSRPARLGSGRDAEEGAALAADRAAPSEGEGRPVLLAVVRDLFFGSRIARVAEALGARVIFVRQREDLGRLIAVHGAPVLLIDLTSPGWNWSVDLPQARGAARQPFHVLAFGPHAQGAVLKAARAAGCDRVVSNARFSAKLPELLGTVLRGPAKGPDGGDGARVDGKDAREEAR